MPNTREMELWRLVNKAFQNSMEKFGDIFAKDVTRDLLANGVTIQKWIPVTESGFYDTDPEWGDIPMDDVTHWMPLPPAPKGE